MDQLNINHLFLYQIKLNQRKELVLIRWIKYDYLSFLKYNLISTILVYNHLHNCFYYKNYSL